MSNNKSHLVVASHNLAKGKWIADLVPYYRALQASRGLDILCVQENLLAEEKMHISRIAEALEGRYLAHYDRLFPDPAILYNAGKFTYIDQFAISLPKPDRYDWLGRVLGSEDAPVKRYAFGLRLRFGGGKEFTVVNFHLDAWGGEFDGKELSGNAIRRMQLEAIRGGLEKRGITERILLCGDTNLHLHTLQRQRRLLREALTPFGVTDPGTTPTHHFDRRIEFSRPWQWSYYLLGKLGILRSLRLDTIASDMPIVKTGTVVTKESDHDLIYAEVNVS